MRRDLNDLLFICSLFVYHQGFANDQHYHRDLSVTTMGPTPSPCRDAPNVTVYSDGKIKLRCRLPDRCASKIGGAVNWYSTTFSKTHHVTCDEAWRYAIYDNSDREGKGYHHCECKGLISSSNTMEPGHTDLQLWQRCYSSIIKHYPTLCVPTWAPGPCDLSDSCSTQVGHTITWYTQNHATRTCDEAWDAAVTDNTPNKTGYCLHCHCLGEISQADTVQKNKALWQNCYPRITNKNPNVCSPSFASAKCRLSLECAKGVADAITWYSYNQRGITCDGAWKNGVYDHSPRNGRGCHHCNCKGQINDEDTLVRNIGLWQNCYQVSVGETH